MFWNFCLPLCSVFIVFFFRLTIGPTGWNSEIHHSQRSPDVEHVIRQCNWWTTWTAACSVFLVCEHPLESLEPNLTFRSSQGLFCGKEQDLPTLAELREDFARKYHTDVENCLCPGEEAPVSSIWLTFCPPCCPISSADLDLLQLTTQQREREEEP